ncbi:MAG: HAMP domain-containing histidine kinase, partial [Lachnospiraceae bacterium]|nr:HAMP domain-containing histidine kinase [Lachnospiraceae bacterium]
MRYSVMAKLTAWLLCIVSVMGTVVLGFFLAVGVMEDMWGQTREEALKDNYRFANMRYSVDAFRNRGNRAEAQKLREMFFKYGIIKSNSLEGVDFHDRLSYLETNMTEQEIADLVPDALYLYLFVESENGSCWYSEPMEYYGNYEDIASLTAESDSLLRDSGWSYLYADRICYDVAEGIIYYRADENYYPVQNVSLCYDGSAGRTVYNYNYDFDNEGYQLSYQSKDTTVFEKYTDEFAAGEELLQETGRAQPGQTDAIEEILAGEGIVNLADLNNTTFGYSNWGTILLDNIRSIRGDELTLIDSRNIADGFFVREAGYFLNEDYTLVVQEDIQAEAYWVVSLVPDDVPSDCINSLYNQQSWFINLYYDIVDSNLFQGLGISIAVMALSFGFLVYASGHRRTVDGIVLTFLDRIPVDILSVFVVAAELSIILIVLYIVGEVGIWKSADISIGVCGLFGSIMTVIAVAYMLSLCVRVKAGKWWRNSICYRIYSRIRDLIVTIFRHIGLLWKAVFLVGAVSVVELFVLAAFEDGAIAFYLVERVVLCAGLCAIVIQINKLQKAGQCMAEGNLSYKIDTEKMFWECKKHGEYLNKISEGMSKAVDERMKSERLKTELITNVSHDIKTPLTSIINYVDLLSKEELHNDKAAEYLEVLERQSSKLKKLIEDLVEASKASSGNLAVDSQQLEAGVIVTQMVGEFEEKLLTAGLELIVGKPEVPVYIMADGRHIWRVVDNLMNNICKYAQKDSRVYVNLEATDQRVRITFRNISKYPLNISGEELMERFVRGDKSRNTEGHGLGLSIAQSLMKLIGGDMSIVVDGDLFKVI